MINSLQALGKKLKKRINTDMLLGLVLGFFSGMPLILISSSLQFWLKDSKVSIIRIGLISLSELPYALQFFWTQVIDTYSIPFFSRILGRRRAWLLMNQLGISITIFAISCYDPKNGIMPMACFALLTALFASTQESLLFSHDIARGVDQDHSRAVNSIKVAGARLGVLFAGAGSLYFASFMSWSTTYKIMAGLQMIGLIFYSMLKEPEKLETKNRKYNLIEPIKDITRAKLWVPLFALLLIYRAGDNLIGGIHGLFYSSLGFSKIEVASISKTFGTAASLFGAFIASYWLAKIGAFRTLALGLSLHILGILSHVVLGASGKSYYMICFVVAFDHITGGMRTSSIINAKQGLCTKPEYAATQFSFMGSIMMLPRIFLASSAGIFVDRYGWNGLFVSASIISVPAVLLVLFIIKKNKIAKTSANF